MAEITDRELNIRVAEVVFGAVWWMFPAPREGFQKRVRYLLPPEMKVAWARADGGHGFATAEEEGLVRCGPPGPDEEAYPETEYSTCPYSSWLVVERMRELGWRFFVTAECSHPPRGVGPFPVSAGFRQWDEGDAHTVEADRRGPFCFSGTSIPRTICLAALATFSVPRAP